MGVRVPWPAFRWVPLALERRVASVVLRPGHLASLKQAEVEKIAGDLKAQGLGVSLDQALSLRMSLLRRQAARGSALCAHPAFAARVATAIGNEGCLVRVAQRFDIPPSQCFEVLVRAKGVSTKNTSRKVACEQAKLTAEELAMVDKGRSADHLWGMDYAETWQRARKFELALEDKLRDAGASFTPGAEAKGRFKPDILFPEPVEIRGRWVRWLDAKNFYLASDDPLVAGLRQQARKYSDHWGLGALVFSQGMCQSWARRNTIGAVLLDASELAARCDVHQFGWVDTEQKAATNERQG